MSAKAKRNSRNSARSPKAKKAPEPTLMDKLGALAKLGRLKFLMYSTIMYTVGSVLALCYDQERGCTLGEPCDVRRIEYFVGLLVVYVIHAATQYINEYIDYDTDLLNAAKSPWTGGSRVLVSGMLPPKIGLIMTVLLGAVSVALALYTRFLGNWNGFAMMLFMLFMGLEYSCPPIRASRRMMSGLWVVIIVNYLCPLLGFMLQLPPSDTRIVPPALYFSVLLPSGIIQFVRMMVMNISDIDADKQVGKITVPVFLGHDTAVKVHNVGMFLGYAALLYLWAVASPSSLQGSDAEKADPTQGPQRIPNLVFGLMLLTVPYAFYYAKQLHAKPFKFELPFHASQHNCFVQLAVYLGLLLPPVIQSVSALQKILDLFFPLLVVVPLLIGVFLKLKNKGLSKKGGHKKKN